MAKMKSEIQDAQCIDWSVSIIKCIKVVKMRKMQRCNKMHC